MEYEMTNMRRRTTYDAEEDTPMLAHEDPGERQEELWQVGDKVKANKKLISNKEGAFIPKGSIGVIKSLTPPKPEGGTYPTSRGFMGIKFTKRGNADGSIYKFKHPMVVSEFDVDPTEGWRRDQIMAAVDVEWVGEGVKRKTRKRKKNKKTYKKSVASKKI